LWQSHVILSHAPPCSCKSKEKEKEKKRNINNDLAILPSHDNRRLIRFIFLLKGGFKGSRKVLDQFLWYCCLIAAIWSASRQWARFLWYSYSFLYAFSSFSFLCTSFSSSFFHVSFSNLFCSAIFVFLWT